MTSKKNGNEVYYNIRVKYYNSVKLKNIKKCIDKCF